MSVTTTFGKDSAGRVDFIKLSMRGKSPVEVRYFYTGDAITVEVKGDKRFLPSISEFIAMIDAKFIGRIDQIALVDLISRIVLIDTIAAITNIANINSVDLIDRITLLDRITLIDAITNIGTLANLTNVGTVNLVNTISAITNIVNIANVQSIDLIDAITNIVNLQSLDLIDRITLIDTITNIGTLATLTNVGTVNLINTIAAITNIASLDLVDRITLIDAITNIGTIGTITTLTGITNPINVKTSGATNIVLDLLTQGAYTDRRSTLSNNGGAPTTWLAVNGADRRSKWFPRGCRGFIWKVGLYCQDVGAVGGTITVSFAPYIGAGAIFTATITIPAGGAQAERFTANIFRMWMYDSMHISFVTSTANIKCAYDNGTPYDDYGSGDSGATWYREVVRWWLNLYLLGETCGDVPVSGIINNIEIPNAVSAKQKVSLDTPAISEHLDDIQHGSGRLLIAIFSCELADDINHLVPRIYCDGVSILPQDDLMAVWQEFYVTATSEGIFLGVWDTAQHYYCLIVKIPFPFKQSLQLGFYNTDPLGSHQGFLGYSYEKIS